MEFVSYNTYMNFFKLTYGEVNVEIYELFDILISTFIKR